MGMRITISQLRRIIREVVDQQAVVPGRFIGDFDYDPEEDPERLAYGGFRGIDEVEEEKPPKRQG